MKKQWLWISVLAVGVSGIAQNPDPRLAIAREKAAANQYEEAAREYKKYLGEHPKAEKVYAELAALRVRQGNYKLAIVNFRSLIELNAEEPAYHRGLAEAYEKSGQKEKAIAKWRNLATLTGDDKERTRAEERIRSLLGKSVSNQGAEPARKVAPKASAKKPKYKAPVAKAPALDIYENPYYKKAKQFYREKQYTRSLEAIREVLKAHPGHPGAYYWAGVIRYNKGEYDKALYNFDKGMDYPARGYNGHYYKGRIFQKQKQWQEALDEFTRYKNLTSSKSGIQQADAQIQKILKAVEASKPYVPEEPEELKITVVQSPDGVSFYGPGVGTPGLDRIKKATAFFSRMETDKSVEAFKELMLQYGGSDLALLATLNLAVAYDQMGLHEKSASHAKEFLKGGIGRLHPMAHYLVAKSMLEAGKVGEAKDRLPLMTSSARLGPGEEDLSLLKSRIYEKSGETQSAIFHMKRAVQDSAGALRESLGDMLARKGDLKGALKNYQAFLKSDCDSGNHEDLRCASVAIKIADLLFKEKQYKQALQKYADFRDKYSTHADAAWCLYQIANISRKQGKEMDALAHYETLIQAYPESYWAEQAKWKHEGILWHRDYGKIMN